MDPRRAPKRIGAAHLPNQASDLRLNRGPTASAPTLPRPVAPEPPSVPPHHCLRPHHLQGIPPALPKRSEEHTSELQSRLHLVCRLLLEKKKNTRTYSLLHPV